MADEKFDQECAALDAACKTKYGDDWDVMKLALSRAGGVPEQGMREILKHPDPGQVLAVAAKERLLAESDAGDRSAEIAFSRIREAERAAHRKLRGGR